MEEGPGGWRRGAGIHLEGSQIQLQLRIKQHLQTFSFAGSAGAAWVCFTRERNFFGWFQFISSPLIIAKALKRRTPGHGTAYGLATETRFHNSAPFFSIQVWVMEQPGNTTYCERTASPLSSLKDLCLSLRPVENRDVQQSQSSFTLTGSSG